jgi:hypothetical protein
MEIPNNQALDFIRERAGGEQAAQAEQELPEPVDTERDAGLLEKFGVNPQDLLSRFGDVF